MPAGLSPTIAGAARDTPSRMVATGYSLGRPTQGFKLPKYEDFPRHYLGFP